MIGGYKAQSKKHILQNGQRNLHLKCIWYGGVLDRYQKIRKFSVFSTIKLGYSLGYAWIWDDYIWG